MNLRLKYASDWRAISFVSITYFLLLFPVFWHFPGFVTLFWLPLNSLFCFSVGVITHNHMHTPIFKERSLNQLFNIVLTLAMGHTATQIVIPHNYNHHAYHGGAQDWSSPKLAGSGIGLIRLIRYLFEMLKNATTQNRSGEVPALPKHLVRSLPREKLALQIFIAILLIYAPLKAIIFVGIPWIIGTLLMLGINLIQHDGCNSQSQYNHSRNFTGRLSNWFFFNNGYHTIHHLKPTLHWSLLPEAHNRLVKPHLIPELEVKSILAFLFTQYLLAKSPTKREEETGNREQKIENLHA